MPRSGQKIQLSMINKKLPSGSFFMLSVCAWCFLALSKKS